MPRMFSLTTDRMMDKTGIFVLSLVIGGMLVRSPAAGFSAERQDVVMKAMSDELARSMATLRIEGMEKPYYIGYAIIDDELLVISASFGGIKTFRHGHQRFLKTDVRVGDYALDNSNFLGNNMAALYAGRLKSIAIEDDYDAIRHSIWLATDEAYKAALDNLAQKQACIKNRNQTDLPSSFARIDTATVSTAPDVTIGWNDARWKRECIEISNVFKKFPKISGSEVSFLVTLRKRYFTNSEGTKTVEPQCLVSLEVRATTQAPDGMRLGDFISYAGLSPEALPAVEDIVRDAERMAGELSDLSDAPVVDDYSGPVLIAGEASAEFFRQLLGENLCGRTPPLSENESFVRAFASRESAFKGKMGMAVLPVFFDVSADPARTEFEGRPLAGTYRTDDEGVRGRPVQLVEKGVLKGYLMSRMPTRDSSGSNGHGRGGIFGGAEARISNLIIQASDGKSFDELKGQLIDLCRRQNKPYGLLIRTLEQSGRGAESSSSLARMPRDQGVPGERLLSRPLVVYQVFLDGTEKPVRGADFSDVTVRVLKDIVSASSSQYVYSVASADLPMYARQSSQTPPVGLSIVAPAILVEEMDLKRIGGMQEKPPFMKNPYFK